MVSSAGKGTSSTVTGGAFFAGKKVAKPIEQSLAGSGCVKRRATA